MVPKRILIILIVFPFIWSCDQNQVKQKASEKSIITTYLPSIDSTLMENSGILFWNKKIWTINDSGGKNEIYALDPKTGKIKITLQVENSLNTDWEDIAQDENSIYIAEFGNNLGNRKDLQVLKIAKNEINKEPFQKLKAEKINFQYSDQTCFANGYKSHEYDCEALCSFNDQLYLFTKDWVKNQTKVYALPKKSGMYIVSPIDSFNVNGLITGADIKSNGTLALIGYRDYKSLVWVFKKTDKSLFGSPQFIGLDSLRNAQTEGICFTPKGDLLISCERTANFTEQIWCISKNNFN